MLFDLITVFLIYKEYSYTDQQKVTENRITTINDFIRSIDTDSKRVIYISGFRALIAMEDYIAKTGRYLNGTINDTQNPENLFRCAFYYGTVNVSSTNCSNGSVVDVLKNSTYSDYLNKLREIASTVGIDINITVPNITGVYFYQETPWQVIVNVTVQVNLSDRNLSCNTSQCLARWNFNKAYSANISIINLRDPVYIVATYGKVQNAIRITNTTDFVINKDPAGLMNHIRNMSYNASSLAPNFLMRLAGRLNESSACCGIESFVYIPNLLSQGLSYNTSRSIIDYILFNSGNVSVYENVTLCVQNITDNPAYSWFKIDVNHTVTPSPHYIDNLNYSTTSTIC